MLYFEDKESDTFMVFFDIIFSEVVELRFLINMLTVFINLIGCTIFYRYLGGSTKVKKWSLKCWNIQ